MVHVMSNRAPANGFVAGARKVYNPLGFNKGYNFVLFVVFAGALMGFTLARLQFLDIDNIFCGPGFSAVRRAAPGECFYYRFGIERIGIILHLACVLPACFLACWQFVPVIRHKFMIFHRINGYIILLLSVVGTVGALLAARHAFGGGLPVQAVVGLIAIMFIGSLTVAYINIKRLQIEQHRAWMLRAWFYAGAIVTARPIMFIAALIVSRQGGYFVPMPCKVIEYLLNHVNNKSGLPQGCEAYLSGENPEQWTAVLGKLGGAGPASAAAALQSGFGMAVWLALALHAIGIEIYLHLTPAEAERLRNVSYQRQLEAGMNSPGRAGLTSDRLGDSEKWEPTHDHRDRQQDRALMLQMTSSPMDTLK